MVQTLSSLTAGTLASVTAMEALPPTATDNKTIIIGLLSTLLVQSAIKFLDYLSKRKASKRRNTPIR